MNNNKEVLDIINRYINSYSDDLQLAKDELDDKSVDSVYFESWDERVNKLVTMIDVLTKIKKEFINLSTNNTMTDELYNKLVCALTHDMKICEDCKKCKGDNFAQIRVNLIRELATQENKPLPWKEDK